MNKDEINLINNWKRPLQQALIVEVENGFRNLHGREEYFHSFVVRKLSEYPSFLSAEVVERLTHLRNGFTNYPSSTEYIRRRLIIELRQYLQRLSSQYQEDTVIKPPLLNIDKTFHQKDIVHLRGNSSLSLISSLKELPGVGMKMAQRLSSLGLVIVKDLLEYYPRDYVDYTSLRRISELQIGETATVVATVRRCNSFTSPKNPNLSILDLQLQDPTGRLKVTRFFAGRRFSNRAYLKTQERLYPLGSSVAVCGLVKDGQYGKNFTDPVIEVLDNPNSLLKSRIIGRILPVYPLADGISADRLRGFIEIALSLLPSWADPIPKHILQELSLPSKSTAIKDIHRPGDRDSLKKAKRRLVFDELFIFQLSLLRRRQLLRSQSSPVLEISYRREDLVGLFLESLPFDLTSAQKRVLAEIESDLSLPNAMARLLQGDVGSGKTVIATAALLNAVQCGWQGALMAPTEVLAEQHYKNLCKWLPQLHVSCDLITGSTTSRKRRRILDDLIHGSLKILVGTHALIEEPVTFSRLGLVVVDEQHRFGVRQRNLLLNKGLQPHLLTMTATPIPRTLALSLHGDLDVSQIDELPPGRTPIKTKLCSMHQMDNVYDLIRYELIKGQQAYVVLPLVDESEKLDLRSAIKVHEELSRDIYPDFSVGLLHGRMNGVDKQRVIEKFLNKQFHILVSTTVVEVGVDVPNATVMVVENADRFGLAQLHQLRGRVGRGPLQSHCILLYDSNNKVSKQRLEVLSRTNDGFEISEIDLRLRGPGQVLGTKQSGLPDLALASLIEDAEILEIARQQAFDVLKDDTELREYPLLKSLIDEHWKRFNEKAHLN